MNKPKLLHVVESFGGGVFTFLADLSNALCDRYDITIAYTLRPQTPEHFQRYSSTASVWFRFAFLSAVSGCMT